MKSTIGNFV